jgi:hypothetical protein
MSGRAGFASGAEVHVRQSLPSKEVNAIFNIQSPAPVHEGRAGEAPLGYGFPRLPARAPSNLSEPARWRR